MDVQPNNAHFGRPTTDYGRLESSRPFETMYAPTHSALSISNAASVGQALKQGTAATG